MRRGVSAGDRRDALRCDAKLALLSAGARDESLYCVQRARLTAARSLVRWSAELTE